jgi:DNA-3-methyladenine glycosylase I
MSAGASASRPKGRVPATSAARRPPAPSHPRVAAADGAATARTRCAWARGDLDVRYHDEEWGVPVRDDRALFELLILEGAQAGLSWSTILRKREAYRTAFAGFDPAAVARYTAADVTRLLADAGIVRHRGKIEAAIDSARAVLDVQREHGSFADYIWSFVGGRTIRNAWAATDRHPTETDVSRALSRDLQRRGFRFVGPTICYAFMQAAGLVNDHTTDCFRWRELSGKERAWRR